MSETTLAVPVLDLWCSGTISPRQALRAGRATRGVSSPARYDPEMTVSAVSWFKLDRACEITRDLVAKNPLTPDYSSDYMVVQGWPFVVALYSGLEQALKMLLLAQPDARLTLDDLRKHPYRHNLETLFAALPPDDREHIELHFREHWSLYEYDTPGAGHLRSGRLHRSHQQRRQAERRSLVAVRPRRRNGDNPADEPVDDVRHMARGLLSRQDEGTEQAGRLLPAEPIAGRRFPASGPAHHSGSIR